MHDSVRQFVTDVIDAQTPDGTFTGARVVEFGSRNVNGTVRDLFDKTVDGWLGIDGEAGPGVDYVCQSWNTPFDDGAFDVVVSTEMLEHDERPDMTFKEANRLLRRHGHLIVTCRGPGFRRHDFPHDYWRFTPDDLVRLAEAAGFEVIRAIEDPQVPGAFLHAMKARGPHLADLLGLELTPLA